MRAAGADYWIADSEPMAIPGLAPDWCVPLQPALQRCRLVRRHSHDTDWVLLTSGTSGAPKLVLHTLATLSSAMSGRGPQQQGVVWSTFYDIRRYGGLQILLRALRGGSLILSHPAESASDFLARAGGAGLTHISGTPSHWRKALMSGASSRIAPQYVRLSGEIADQSILDALHTAYPQATVSHAFASTEAGVGFEVNDAMAGFPASLLGAAGGEVHIKVEHGTLHLRSPGNALRYLGDDAPALRDPDGYVDTGDRIELRDGRYHFVGRSSGVINVGGLKVHPEEVEAVINAHPWVRMSLVRARRNSITGAVVVAEVVAQDDSSGRHTRPLEDVLEREIIDICRRTLADYKVPTRIRFVTALELSPSGKLVRHSA